MSAAVWLWEDQQRFSQGQTRPNQASSLAIDTPSTPFCLVFCGCMRLNFVFELNVLLNVFLKVALFFLLLKKVFAFPIFSTNINQCLSG